MDTKKSIKATIIARLNGSLREEELKKLNDWVAQSEENTKYYARVKDLWEASQPNISQIAETEKEWSKFLLNIGKGHRENMFNLLSNWQIVYRFAAILFIGLVVGVLVTKFNSKHETGYVTSIAPAGSVSQMILADSTLVYLNAGSELRYSPETNNKKREVYLTGEAWFQVEKNKQKPFIVHTQYYDVQVTGTQFNVKSYPSDSEVTTTLEEGQVEIGSSENFKLTKNISLQPGEQVVLNKKSKKLFVQNVDTQLFTSWKNNKLIFLNMNLKELIILLERRYGVDIEVFDDDILTYHYSGTIKNESILDIMQIIQHTLPIEFKIENQKIIIHKNKQEE
ncbi:FecR family protein [Maribellus maritimus]|uniref:FecR family protein n=1 Tax=Maribellus maritimus TaxID=2870838 RepID=UPI001EECAFC2|nr:FecR family protein [Maribellus maritimus]MCG6187340.1 FecR family protein [Maribellus maritimus]